MTESEIDAARKICEAATPGPWVAQRFDDDSCSAVYGVRTADEKIVCVSSPNDPNLSNWTGGENDEFIAFSRDFLPRALDALEAANKRIAELEGRAAIDPAKLAAYLCDWITGQPVPKMIGIELMKDMGRAIAAYMKENHP